MRKEQSPEKIDEDRDEGQTSKEVYELPEEAKRYITRLILSRRLKLLREEFGQRDTSLQEGDAT